MINIRHQIFTIVGIFLALGIGILIGNFMFRDGFFARGEEKLIAQLEKDLLSLMSLRDQLKGKITSLESQNAKNEEFIQMLLPTIMTGALDGKDLVFIDFGGKDSARIREQLQEASKKAGAKSITTGSILRDLDISKVPNGNFLAERMGISVSSIESANQEILDMIARALVSGRGIFNLSPLMENGFLTTSGDPQGVADWVVLVAPEFLDGVKKGYTLDLKLINALKKLDADIVGVEVTDAKASRIEEYKAKGISTIDNIDTIPGKVAFIYVLQGKTGNYGVKNSASSLIPVLY